MKTNFKNTVGNLVTSNEALELAGLNFNVAKIPMQSTSGGIQIPDKFATWRTDKIGSPDGYLGVVGNSYKPIQNSDALSFFDSIMSKEEMVYDEAGFTNNGSRVWLRAKLPNSIVINGNDELDEYVVLSNSHDGTSSLEIKFVCVRLVCTNGLTVTTASGRAGMKIRHCSNAKSKIDEAYKVLNLAKSTFKVWEEKISTLSNIEIKPQDLDRYYNQVLNIKDVEKASTRVLNTKDLLNELFVGGMGVELSGGSVWTALNSVTEYVDHHRNYKNGEKDYGTLFGSGDVLKSRASKIAEEMFVLA